MLPRSHDAARSPFASVACLYVQVTRKGRLIEHAMASVQNRSLRNPDRCSDHLGLPVAFREVAPRNRAIPVGDLAPDTLGQTGLNSGSSLLSSKGMMARLRIDGSRAPGSQFLWAILDKCRRS